MARGWRAAAGAEDSLHRRSGAFAGPVTASVFGRSEYQWHPEIDGGTAAPDGPAAVTSIEAHPDTNFTLPAASIAVLRG